MLFRSQVAALVNDNQTLIMTEKDAVKCRAFAEDNWWYLPVDARLDEPAADALLQELIALARP